jgi:hypothetical protein
MAALTAARRNSLPDSKFAGPERSYPVDTANRAKNALTRSSQAVNEGRMSESTHAKIAAKAHAVLGDGKGDGKYARYKSGGKS